MKRQADFDDELSLHSEKKIRASKTVFNDLCDDMLIETNGFLDTSSQLNFRAINTYNYRLFGMPKTYIDKCFQFVVKGDEVMAYRMLMRNPAIMAKKISVTDHAGRFFHNVSMYQYAAWALDISMQTMMESCFSSDNEDLKTLKPYYRNNINS